MINGFTDMVADSLGLTEPWYISGVEFDPDMKQLAIYVKVLSASYS